MTQLISITRLENWFDLEPFIVGGIATILAWVFYYFFLKTISAQRHFNLRKRFQSLVVLFGMFSLLSIAYWSIKYFHAEEIEHAKFYFYWAVVTVYVGAFVVIRMAQICLYLYLFFSHLKVGVPRLIANSFTFLFATVLLIWLTSEIFNFNVTHLIATSAIFSVILGLALQDTLGNLFSGFALQIDRPYSIGDWVEVGSGGQQWIGQIQEINWRATLLMSFMDEMISIPNKTMAQSHVIILSNEKGSARCSQQYRLNFDVELEQAKAILLKVFNSSSGVSQSPGPRLLITDMTESWVTLKVFFTLSDYSLRYRVADELYQKALGELQKHQVKMGFSKIQLMPTTISQE